MMKKMETYFMYKKRASARKRAEFMKVSDITIVSAVLIFIFGMLNLIKSAKVGYASRKKGEKLPWYINLNLVLGVCLADIACIFILAPIAKPGSMLFPLFVFVVLVGCIISLQSLFLVLRPWFEQMRRKI